MNYTKPQVSTLGDATTVIEYNGTNKPMTEFVEPIHNPTAAPAYDLDE